MIDLAPLRAPALMSCFGEPSASDEIRPIAEGLGRERFDLDHDDLREAMANLTSPTFVVRPSGMVSLANEAGMAALKADPQRIREAIDALLLGRQSRLVKNSSVIKLLSSRRIVAFLVILPPDALRSASDRSAPVARWRLTPRENDVVALIARGDANKEIAAKLGVSLRTVEVHIATILRKAGVESRSRLIAHFYTRR